MSEIVAIRRHDASDRKRFHAAVRAHYVCEALREVRENLLAATAIGGALAWVAAMWPAWTSPGVRTFSLWCWPVA